MRIAIDANAIYTTRAGVARYVRGLLRGLEPLQPDNCEWFSLAWEVENLTYAQPQRALKTAWRELVWAKWLAVGELHQRKADLLHSTAGWLIEAPAKFPHVVTLHDLALMRHPERFRRWHRISGTRRLARLAKASQIICISQFTADEAMQLLGLPARQLTIVPNGCDFHFTEPPPVEAAPEAPVPTEFFLFVGSLEPGKNLALLREVWQLAAARGQRLPPLVIVGARWMGVAREGPPPADWHYLGEVSDAVLVHLYRRAQALVFPSKYEGFGLPVAEAMSLGCPVVCSRVASLPEVGGDAALWTNLQPESYLTSLQQLGRDSTLRADLIIKGRAQAAKFSWKQCATETVEVYRKVLR